MNNNLQEVRWSENVILADADYIDKVAFNLIVNFERMLGRRIPQADIARWIDCVALDGGIREGEHETQVLPSMPTLSNRLPEVRTSSLMY